MEELLRNMGREIILLFRNDPSYTKKIHFKDYHGFVKGRIPVSDLKIIADTLHVEPETIQAELVQVSQDLSHEIHFHKFSHALCIVLGASEHVDNPKDASAFIGQRWAQVTQGEVLNIPPNTPHGFTIKERGTLYFLSMQSPPIENEQGDDDYFKVD